MLLQLLIDRCVSAGDVVYLATALFDHYVLDVSYSRPENYYFWFYFFLMNFIWIVIPGGKPLFEREV